MYKKKNEKKNVYNCVRAVVTFRFDWIRLYSIWISFDNVNVNVTVLECVCMLKIVRHIWITI